MALGSYAELIARDDIDLVYVPLPPSAHLEWCTAALANGKHVLVEKPFASNAQDAAQMVAAARAAGRHLIEGFHYRFHPLFAQRAGGAAQRRDRPDPPHRSGVQRHAARHAGRIALHRRTGRRRAHGPWLLLHALDPHRRGRRTHRRERQRARCATPGVDLDIEAELAFTSGPTATLKCSMQPEDGVLFRRLRVQGDKGVLEFDNPVSPHAGATLSIESRTPSMPQIVSGGDTTFHYQLRHVHRGHRRTRATADRRR